MAYDSVEQQTTLGQDNSTRRQRSRRRLQPAGGLKDRRASSRLPIEREVRYKILGRKKSVTFMGSGKTLNMSSRGILFTTESTLPEGASMEIAISWPVQLDKTTHLKLVVLGELVRSDEGWAVISIQRYEFKTRGLNL